MLPRTALLGAVLLLAAGGCAAGDETPGATASAPASVSTLDSGSPTPSPPEDEVVEISVSVRDGKVRPAPRRVEVGQGETVRLVVTSDVDDQIHVHGYEVEADLEAGRPTSVEFRADTPGVFEVETHEDGLELVQLEVR